MLCFNLLEYPFAFNVSAVSEHPYIVTTSYHIVVAADDQRRQRSKPQSIYRVPVSEMHLKTKFNVGVCCCAELNVVFFSCWNILLQSNRASPT